MNTFTAVVFCLAVASASAGHIGYAVLGNHEAHIPSGSVAVGHDGAVIAGPSGSVKTNNGIWGHGAGAQISGPSGDVSTHGGHARLTGPGVDHHEHAIVAAVPAVHAAPIIAAPVAHQAIVAAPAAHATIVGPTSHATIIGPSAHATIVGPSAHAAVYAAPIAHHAVYAAVPAVKSWGYSTVSAHHGVIAHDIYAHGHHGW